MRVSRVDEIDRAEEIHLADVDPAIAQDRMECPGRALVLGGTSVFDGRDGLPETAWSERRN
jgi:hypothetical protein